MSAAAASFPSWVMVERFVFRRDDEDSFPDESKAPIRASGTASWGAPFRFAFELADPPAVSRLYGHFPVFPNRQTPLVIMATHHQLVLFRVGLKDRTTGELLQDFVIYDASKAADEQSSSSSSSSSSSLIRLPRCTLPDLDITLGRRRPPVVYKRVMEIASMGVLSRGEGGGEGGGEFAVAELSFVYPDGGPAAKRKVQVDMFWLRSSSSESEPGSESSDDDDIRSWNSARLRVEDVSNGGKCEYLTWTEDFTWQSDAVIAAHNCLCWINYYRGIVSCNLFQEPSPTLCYSSFPSDELALAEDSVIASLWFYCSATALEAGRAIKIVRVIRHDGQRYGPLKTDDAGFTIVCHTFMLDDTDTAAIGWSRDYSKDCTVTSEELWSLNAPENLPRKILFFPHVNVDQPHVVHFLVVHEFRIVKKKMSVVTIDMDTRIAESCVPYINGSDDVGTENADLMRRRSSCPQPFLASDFSKFLHISR